MKQGINWSKKDLYEAIGRPDLRPEWDKQEVDPFKCEVCGSEMKMTCFSQDADGNREEWMLACYNCE